MSSERQYIKTEHGKDGKVHKEYDLRARIEHAMKGFHGANAIAYKHKNEYVTYSRPMDCLKLAQDDEFVPDKKEIWPVLNDMQTSLPIPRIKRRPNRVDDVNWIVPASDRTPIQPEPVFPQSKGLKLRPIDEIINDKKLLGGKMAPPNGPGLSPTATKKSVQSNSARATSKPKALDAKIQGVLDIITETSRPISNNHTSNKSSTNNSPYKSSSTPPIKNRSTTTTTTKEINKPLKLTTLSATTTNRPRKPSLLKSEITSTKNEEVTPHQMGSKKPMFSLTNSNANRPRVSSKSTSAQKNKYTQDIPDLIEARNYLLGETDEVEFRKLEHLLEITHNTRDMRRPVLLLHFKTASPALIKAAKSHSNNNNNSLNNNNLNNNNHSNNNHSTNNHSTNNHNHNTKAAFIPTATTYGKTLTSIKHEDKPTTNVNKKNNVSEIASHQTPSKLKTTTTTTSADSPLISAAAVTTHNTPTKTTNSSPPAIKKSLSDRPQKVAEEKTADNSKQVYPSSIPAAFLRSMKIPKRKTSEIELEEGETISPSPSPHHSSAGTTTNTPPLPATKLEPPTRRSRNDDADDSIAPTPATIAATPVAAAATSSDSTSAIRKHSSSSRRDEERSSSSRRSDRHYDDRRSSTKSSSHRSSHYRSKSRSRSRSPARSHRSESRSKTRRQTSSESSRRRQQSPPPSSSSRSEKRKNPDKYEADSGSSKRQRSSEKESSREKEKIVVAEKETKYTSTSSNSKKASPTVSTALPEKTISATAPNAETPEQFKVFTIMFNKLAHANKRRGDTQTDPVFGMIDHFHAFCDYILNFYYVDRLSPNASFKQASAAWKSIFPFTDSLLKKLESRKEHELYGLCVRLNSLIRFYMYSRMESSTRPVLLQQINNTNGEKMTDRACVELSSNLLHEYEKAERAYKDSERHMSYSTLVTQYPETFRNVCMEGNLLAGITLGGEAGVSVSPMFPFAPYSPLHHAAIVSKCILSEYVSKNNLKYTPISKPEEFM